MLHYYFTGMPLTTCPFCLSATLLPCALGVIGLDTWTEYKLNYLTSCLCSECVYTIYRFTSFCVIIIYLLC